MAGGPDGLHVVLGASGGIGSAVTEALARLGRRVRAISRSGPRELPDGVEHQAVDLSDPGAARSSCEGASVVYHCAQPDYTRWSTDFVPLTEAARDAAAAAGAKLVFADNLYMYGPVDGPISERTPMRATGTKGRVRIRMAELLLDAHADGRVRVAIGRASDYYGPRGRGSVAGDQVFESALRGRRARWLGSLDQPHSLNYLEDVGRALVLLGERDRADGEVWHLPAAQALTGRQFLELVWAELGERPRIGLVSRPMLMLAGLFVPLVRELRETLYQFQRPFVSDASRFQAAFGPFDVTPHEQAVARTVAWFRPHVRGL